MDFNYRTNGEQASPYSFLTEQASRAGYLRPPGNDFLEQRKLREAILIELEKERIRQEVIATEIARKRAVVDELRRGQNGSIERSIGFANHSHESLAEERIGMSLEKWLGIRAATRQETAPFHYRYH
ncbi:Hypothetical predicted protein [Olea europaea subsp. europaea]|uniref:Uncharacterized protein n=1 Tax=Olea europaea subsp. europaea TaxID=158383 RepID=A0A8S0Q7V4_OLEEU|nr:Hypothetical predicted protein [Olea europaea subsp. europaea]